jgi:hypothetical protein
MSYIVNKLIILINDTHATMQSCGNGDEISKINLVKAHSAEAGYKFFTHNWSSRNNLCRTATMLQYLH